MLAVAEVTEPGLQARRVVLANLLAVGLERCSAGDGGPLPRGLEEGEVDVGVRFEVVSLARFAVGVEEEVNAVSFLSWLSV